MTKSPGISQIAGERTCRQVASGGAKEGLVLPDRHLVAADGEGAREADEHAGPLVEGCLAVGGRGADPGEARTDANELGTLWTIAQHDAGVGIRTAVAASGPVG